MKKIFGKTLGKTKNGIKKAASVKFIVTLALIVVIGTLGFFANHKYNTSEKVAERVFWGAVDTNLKTASFTRSSTTKSGGQSATQIADVFISPKQGVHTQTRYVQTGVDEAEAVTENISTPYTDYVRYISISTSQRNAQGKSYDFSDILNVWGGSAPDYKETNGQLYGQSVLTAIPTGNLTAVQRQKLISMMKDSQVYEFTAAKPVREGLWQRPSYTFSVTLKPAVYVTVLKQFGEHMGLTQLKNLNPEDYKNAPKSSFQVTVDGWSRQITGMVEPGSSRQETISGRNARKTLPATPTNVISIEELQSRLQSVE